jgi:3-methyladenine DNA glycosylase AlkD
MEAKALWESTLTGAVAFRGVPVEGIREAVDVLWREELAPGEDRLAAGLSLSLALLREPLGDDKLAGVLLLAEKLADDLTPADLPRLAALFDEGAVADGNTCDWLAVKLLAQLVTRKPDGTSFARAIAAWRDAPGLWRRRAACIAFVPVAKRGDAAFPGLTRLVLGVCERTVRDPERFAQTGTGWVLRELSLADRPAVLAFVERNLPRFSVEALRSVTEKMPKTVARDLLARHAALHRPGA